MDQMNFENSKERKKSSDSKVKNENQKGNKKLTQLIKNNSGKDLNYQKYEKTVSPKNIEYSECKKFII